VQNHLFAVATLDDSPGLHQRVALAPAVPGVFPVDVQRVQAVRAMVPVSPAAGGRADELPALATTKRLVGFRARRSARRFRRGRRPRLRLMVPALAAVGEGEVGGGQVVRVNGGAMAM
jgi:hypothetical protein